MDLDEKQIKGDCGINGPPKSATFTKPISDLPAN